MQELKDFLGIEANILRKNHSSVWHTVRNRVFFICYVFGNSNLMKYCAKCINSILVTLNNGVGLSENVTVDVYLIYLTYAFVVFVVQHDDR